MTETNSQVVELAPEERKKLSLVERMLLVERDMPDIPKDGQNLNDKGEVRYTFRTAEAVTRAVSALHVRYGIKAISRMDDHRLHTRTEIQDGAEVSRGVKAVVKMTFLFINTDKPSELLEIPWVAEGNDWADKGTNKASTTAQKNMYMRVYNIADEDPDAETLASTGLSSPTSKISDKKVTIINTMLRRLKQSPTDFETAMKKPIDKMSNAEADDAISRMESVIARQLAEQAAGVKPDIEGGNA